MPSETAIVSPASSTSLEEGGASTTPQQSSPSSPSSTSKRERKILSQLSSSSDTAHSASKARTKKPDAAAVPQLALPTQLDEVLNGTSCPCTKDNFRDFLVSQHADENLDFLDTIDRYVEVYDKLTKNKAKMNFTEQDITAEYQEGASISGFTEGSSNTHRTLQSTASSIISFFKGKHKVSSDDDKPRGRNESMSEVPDSESQTGGGDERSVGGESNSQYGGRISGRSVIGEQPRARVSSVASGGQSSVKSKAKSGDGGSSSGSSARRKKKDRSQSGGTSGALCEKPGMDARIYARLIQLEFISENASRQVNLNVHNRRHIEQVLDSLDIEKNEQPPKDLFNGCYLEIRKMLANDSFPRFMKEITTKNFPAQHAWFRYKVAFVGLLISIAVLLAMVLTGISPWYRLFLSQPLGLMCGTFAQGWFRLCNTFAGKGIRLNKGDDWKEVLLRPKDKKNIVTHTAVQKAIRRRANKMYAAAIFVSWILTVACLMIPPSVGGW